MSAFLLANTTCGLAAPGPAPVLGAMSAQSLWIATLAALLGVTLLAFGVCLLLIHRAMRKLESSATRLAAGSLSTRVSAQGPLHIGRLASTLNKMARQLDDRLSTVVRQRNELGAVLSSMVEGVVAVDLEERVISLNRAGAGLLRAEAGSLIGRPIQEAVRNPRLVELIRDTVRKRKAVTGEMTLRGGIDSTRERSLQVQTALLREGSGELLGVLVVLHDVTQLRRLESVRRDFVANVSHEVKTPVSAIKAAIETILDDPDIDVAQARQFMRMIARQSDRLDAIVEDLLTLTRIENESESHDVELTTEPVETIIWGAVETCGAKASAKEIALEVQADPEVYARMNGLMLEQALVNLIDNAVKYSDERTTVRVEMTRDEGEVVVAVRDQGRGVEADHLTRIFERFYRTDKARSRDLGGTGLGLSIVKHAAEALGGRVSVDSEPGVGSEFRIHLQAAEPEAEVEDQEGSGSISVNPGPDGPMDVDGVRLVKDDSSVTAEAGQDGLEDPETPRLASPPEGWSDADRPHPTPVQTESGPA
ncbi:MAG: ATP-binding protein [Planctomycetota bacterium]